MAGDRAPAVVLADTDLFFFYLRGGKHEAASARVLEDASQGLVELRTSSEVYDDAISAIRADGLSLEVARSFVADMKSIPHVPLPTGAEIAEKALALYSKHGGRRRLSYFDSFHVATAERYNLPMLTSDQYIIRNATELKIRVTELSNWSR